MSEPISWAGFAYQYRAIVEKAEDAHRKMKTSPSAASEKYHYALGRRQGMEDAIKALQGYHTTGEFTQFLADMQGLIPAFHRRCPYLDCTFRGTEEEVDEHRTTGVHNDEPQAGSNLRAQP